MKKETFFKILIYTSIFFMIFFVFYGFKTISDDVCSTETLKSSTSNNLITLTNDNNQTFYPSVADKYFQNVESTNVCLNIVTNSSTYLEVKVLGKSGYVNNLTTGFTCYENVGFSEKIVVKCVDCNTSNALKISLSEETGVYNNGVSISKTSYPQYWLQFRENCEEFYKEVIVVYFAVLGLIAFIFLMTHAIKWFERWLYQW